MQKRLLALSLALILTFSVTACSGGSGDNDSETDGGKFSESSVKLPEYKPTSDKVSILTTADPSDLKNPNLWIYNLNEKMKAEYNCELEYIRTTNTDFAVKASQLVLSGNSPDLIQYRAKDNPTFISNDIVQPLDDSIDFNEPVFKHLKDINDKFRVNGKVYTLVRNYRNNGYTYWWVKDLEDAGLEDPRSLYYKDEWTWSKMEEYAKALTLKASDGTVSRYGVNFDAMMHVVTGETYVKYADGNYTNNLRSAKLAEFFNYTARLTYEAKVRPIGVTLIDDFKAHNASIILGQRTLLDNSLIEEQKAREVSFAPIPRWDTADKYYTPALYGTTWVAKGAKNLEGACAYFATYVLLISGVDPEIATAVRNLSRATKGYTEEDYELIDAMESNKDNKFTLVDTYDEGLGVNWCVSQRAEMVNSVQNWNKPWATAIEEYSPLLDAAIKEDAQKK